MQTEITSTSTGAAPSEESKLGHVTISPDTPVSAADHITWTISFTTGQYGIDDGGAIMLAVRQMCDWGDPQCNDPAGENYVTAATTADATLQISWNRRANLRPWRQALIIRVFDGHLGPGDVVTVKLGDRSGGSAGLRAQTFVESEFAIRVLADPTGSHKFENVGDLSVPIVAGPASGIALIGSSTAVVDEATWLHVRAFDAWGNVATTYEGELEFSVEDVVDFGATLPARCQMTANDRGVRRFEPIAFSKPGIWRVSVKDVSNGFVATANPCRVVEVGEDPKRLYWGDLHGQSGETVGSGDAAAYWDFLHYASGADYGAHCGNDFQITPEFYRRLRELAQLHHEPERFVTFLSYEWSGNHLSGGDHNVYFLHDDEKSSPIHRSGSWLLDAEPDDAEERHPLAALQAEFRGRDDVIILPHVGGRRANLDMLDDVVQSPVIEISSIHGRFPWFAQDALERGLKVGFIAGSDDHCGRPGVAPPSAHDLVVTGGLSAIYAESLTRRSLWDSLKARHCYGSSGERIFIDLEADGHPMGSEYETSEAPKFQGEIHATAPIATVELRRGPEVVWTFDALTVLKPDLTAGANQARLRLAWSGARSKNRPKVQNWNGEAVLAGGKILNASPYNLSHPEEGLILVDDHIVRWNSHTSGEADGIWLELELTPEATLTFSSPAISKTFKVAELGQDPTIVEAGGVDLQLEVRWVSDAPGPLDLDWSFTDEAVPAGDHAYWLWVTQTDGACAWSSPIYIRAEGTRPSNPG